MPLHALKAPPEAVDEVNRAIVAALKAPGLLRGVLQKQQVGRPGLTAPHHVHALTVQEVADGQDLTATSPSLVRLLVTEDRDVVAFADVAVGEDGTVGKFRKFTRGRSVRGTVRALAAAEELAAVKNGAFELRGVSVPALYVQALWLKDEKGTDDLVLGTDPAFAPVEPMAPQEFVEALQTRARGMLAATEELEA